MKTLEGIPWTRLAAESIAIVGSILLAFAIDAWWDDRADRSARLALLKRLQADFEAIRPELAVVKEEHALRQQAAYNLLESVSAGDTIGLDPDLDEDIALAFIGSRTFQPGTGAVDAFVNGEGARLIENDRLADLLLAWPGLVEELQEEEQRLLRSATNRWTPHLASKTSLAPYVAVLIEYDSDFARLPARLGADSARQAFKADQEFLNLALERLSYQSLARRDVLPLIAAVDEILLELSQELDEHQAN